jgi:hypothetical protein
MVVRMADRPIADDDMGYVEPTKEKPPPLLVMDRGLGRRVSRDDAGSDTDNRLPTC